MLNLLPLEHVKPWAKMHRLLLFDEMRDNSLALFAFRNYMYKHNLNLYADGGFVSLGSVGICKTRGVCASDYYLPYVRTAFCSD
jgi:hypothetical protein